MSSGITLSGFNQIDFNQILEVVMQQERQPVALLETQKKVVDAQKAAECESQALGLCLRFLDEFRNLPEIGDLAWTEE